MNNKNKDCDHSEICLEWFDYLNWHMNTLTSLNKIETTERQMTFNNNLLVLPILNIN